MLKKVIIIALVVIIALVAVLPAAAHRTGPCGPEGDFSGQEYAQHHIREFAQDGDLGHGGHMPGAHHGYSACNPSGH